VPKKPEPSRLPYAILVYFESFIGIQTARILAGHNVPVLGIAKNPEHPFCKTNACEEILVADSLTTDLIDKLKELGPTLKQKAVLFPCSDMSMLLISRHRKELEAWYHITLPEPDVVEMLTSKTLFYSFAQEAGFPVPKTALLRNAEDARNAADALTFPCIVKPAVKTTEWMLNSGGVKVYPAASAKEFLALYDRCGTWADTLMVQEWVEGPETNLYSCNCYFNKTSEPLVTFIARKIRQWPPQTGISCLSKECRNDTVLQETLRLFKSVDYRGLGYLEMKQDERTGKHVIIEPNIGRPTGRSAICEAGGIELIYTAYCDAVGLPLPDNRQQTYRGAKWIHWRRDLQSAFHYWRRGELTLKEWRDSLRGKKRCAVFSWSDPKPFWLDITRVAVKQIRSVFHKPKPSTAARSTSTSPPSQPS